MTDGASVSLNELQDLLDALLEKANKVFEIESGQGGC